MGQISTTSKTDDQEVVARVSEALKIVREEMLKLFPEREWLINQLLLGLVTGQHVLIYGTHGTAKSLITKTFFDAIVGKGIAGEDKQVFIIQLDPETTTDKLIGPPNIPLYEKTGVMVPMVDGYLPTAHFAYLDEIFDAPAVLRSLNDALNERRVNDGKYNESIPLIMAIAATNRSPEAIVAMYPDFNIGAFNDRFLLVSQVGYLNEAASIEAMLTNYVLGNTLNATLNFADIQRVVQIIRAENQIPSNEFLGVYADLMAAFRKKNGAIISDRRIAWLTQLIEAQAILQGRLVVYIDDIRAVVYGLAESADSKLTTLFNTVADPILTKAQKDLDEHVDEAERLQLERIQHDIKAIETAIKQPGWPTTDAEIGATLRNLADLNRELRVIQVQLKTNEQLKTSLLQSIESLTTTVKDKL